MSSSALSWTLISACMAMQVNAFMTPVPMNLNAARIVMSNQRYGFSKSPIGFRTHQVRSSKFKVMASGTESSANPIAGTGKQIGKLLTATPSLVTLVGLNILMTRLLKHIGLSFIPAPLVGMFVIFFGLLMLKDADAARVMGFFKPGVDLVTRFLPMFYVPALVVLPLSASTFAGVDVIRALGVVLFSQVLAYSLTALVTTALQNIA
eukprot:CAMPEP_0172186830 /NCGR_PEP_ID=MMETSP1050-20130122/20986_1 /TAXON_ID=233186 /ORGANISM="Cryptomonas curvata, Strain CCAP979/52" /LENGTH=206 /DNA_ID=CAMNT_0012861057 /DNA_START=165 /DNA_END=781 /DNA_ORIENTATION=+